MTDTKTDHDTAQNRTTPAERGRADFYFRSRLGPRPHYHDYLHRRVEEPDMTPEQIAEYHAAWKKEAETGDRWQDEADF
jgi:hypothetical protein